VLEDKTFARLGESRAVQVDVRIVSASNKSLDAECRANRFRSDLLFRLKSVFISLPPLRERPADIPILAEHFVKEVAGKMGKPEMRLSPEAVRELAKGSYPGNARELLQLVTNAVIVAEGSMIHPHHFPWGGAGEAAEARRLSSLKENEDAHVVYVLRQTEGDRNAASRILGVSLRQLQRKIATLRSDPQWRDLLHDK
jgi:DNA-binding NtrC family response regulator